MDWVEPKKSIAYKDTTPIMVIVPGIAGENTDAYLVNPINDAIKQGYRVVFVNHRGGSGS